MPHPIIYSRERAPLINFDFIDILNKAGYVVTYGAEMEGGEQKITRQPLISNPFESTFQSDGGGLQGEENFDFTFGTSQKIKGELFVSVTYSAVAQSSETANCFLKVRPIHYDGSSETEMASQITTATVTEEGDTSTEYRRTTIIFDVDQKFNRGDILRIEIEVHSTTGTNAVAGFQHDGVNRNFGQVEPAGVAIDSTLLVLIPFDLGGIV